MVPIDDTASRRAPANLANEPFSSPHRHIRNLVREGPAAMRPGSRLHIGFAQFPVRCTRTQRPAVATPSAVPRPLQRFAKTLASRSAVTS